MRRNTLIQRKTAKDQRGMTMLELMISLSILVVGLLGLMSLLLTAVAGNGRNKTDTNSTLVAQMFMESILNQPGGSTTAITDCAGTSFTIATAGPATAGTSLGASLTSDGRIDFTQAKTAVAANYKATYVSCGSSGTTTTFDVRWNVRAISGSSRLVTVSAQNGVARGGLVFVAPVNLRSILAN